MQYVFNAPSKVLISLINLAGKPGYCLVPNLQDRFPSDETPFQTNDYYRSFSLLSLNSDNQGLFRGTCSLVPMKYIGKFLCRKNILCSLFQNKVCLCYPVALNMWLMYPCFNEIKLISLMITNTLGKKSYIESRLTFFHIYNRTGVTLPNKLLRN